MDPAAADLMDLDPADPQLNEAAVKIQASFRGHKARKELKKPEDDKTPTEEGGLPFVQEEMLDPNDPEVQKAAAKIQASFRGYMVRKQVKEMQSPTGETPES